MKPFEKYQYTGGEMSKRDKEEVGSKFWNEGKWENFVVPFLPRNCKGKTLIDMGCNIGLFLKLAKDEGFDKVIGVDSNKGAMEGALVYRKDNLRTYDIHHLSMENSLDKLPVAHFTIMANVHYYFTVADWLEYINRLKEKTLYFIIVTAEKKPNLKYAPSDVQGIRKDLKDWEEIGIIDIPKDNTPHSRHLTGLCFKSNIIHSVAVDGLDNGNYQQRGFLEELDRGVNPIKTNYYKRLKDYRKRIGSKQQIWLDDKLIKYMEERVALYEDIKKNGMKEAITVSKDNRITDGNHRHEIVKQLRYRSILIKKA